MAIPVGDGPRSRVVPTTYRGANGADGSGSRSTSSPAAPQSSGATSFSSIRAAEAREAALATNQASSKSRPKAPVRDAEKAPKEINNSGKLDALKRMHADARDTTPKQKSEKTSPKPAVDDSLSMGKLNAMKQRHADSAEPSSKSKSKGKANDGLSDYGLRKGQHKGKRDERIADLEQRRESLREERAKLNREIAEVREEIKRETSIAQGIDKHGGVITSGINFVGGLFGRKNVVQETAAALLQSDEDKKRLQMKEEATRDLLKANEQAMKQLDEEKTLNFLASVAHTTGMDGKVADFLEDGSAKAGGKTDVKLHVREQTVLGSDAEYDSKSKSITVGAESIDEAGDQMRELQKQGIVDEDGNIKDAARFDKSKQGDKAIKTTSLIAVHEFNHAEQDARGSFKKSVEAKEKILSDAEKSIPAHANASERARIMTAAEKKGENVRSAMVEVDSYRKQEQNDLRAGAVKAAFMTIDVDGKPLGEKQALENVMAFQNGTALVHGMSKGWIAPKTEAADESSAGEAAPGYRAPGYRAPGYRAPGYRAPGEEAPGYRAPGYRAPGYRAPGYRAPGYRAPGYRAPGEEAPGYRAPGYRAPGYRAPGDVAPGYRAPGYRAPGYRAPGDVAPGYRAPGYRAPGSIVD